MRLFRQMAKENSSVSVIFCILVCCVLCVVIYICMTICPPSSSSSFLDVVLIGGLISCRQVQNNSREHVFVSVTQSGDFMGHCRHYSDALLGERRYKISKQKSKQKQKTKTKKQTKKQTKSCIHSQHAIKSHQKPSKVFISSMLFLIR